MSDCETAIGPAPKIELGVGIRDDVASECRSLIITPKMARDVFKQHRTSLPPQRRKQASHAWRTTVVTHQC
jgi:hypothetical protein